MPKSSQTGPTSVFRNLVVAIIAVNSYPIHKALEITSAEKPLGWVNQAKIPNPQPTAFEIKTQIMDSGYDRGDYVALLLGQRIHGCLGHIQEKGASSFFALISESQNAALYELHKLPGVGPRVMKNFVELQFNSKGEQSKEG